MLQYKRALGILMTLGIAHKPVEPIDMAKVIDNPHGVDHLLQLPDLGCHVIWQEDGGPQFIWPDEGQGIMFSPEKNEREFINRLTDLMENPKKPRRERGPLPLKRATTGGDEPLDEVIARNEKWVIYLLEAPSKVVQKDILVGALIGSLEISQGDAEGFLSEIGPLIDEEKDGDPDDALAVSRALDEWLDQAKDHKVLEEFLFMIEQVEDNEDGEFTEQFIGVVEKVFKKAYPYLANKFQEHLENLPQPG